MTMNRYNLLGRSGLRVSPIALGTMTFGTEWGWGADEKSAQRLFDLYVDTGGNFIDTADLYTEGTSEKWLGKFVAARGLRERLVIANLAGRPMAQVALNWLHQKRGVSSIIVGATRPEQLQESLSSLDFTLAPELIARLDAVSEPARPFPYYMFADGHQARIHGQVEVADKPAAYSAPVKVPASTA